MNPIECQCDLPVQHVNHMHIHSHRHCILSIRKTLAEVNQEAFLGPNKELLFK